MYINSVVCYRHFYKACYVLVLVFLQLIINSRLSAHNGAIGYAYPVSGITIDGDLRDWPTNIERYNMERIRVGVPAENEADLSANFRIGYDATLNVLLLAVEVFDQSIQTDTSGYVNWNTHDGMEIYLDPDHLQSVSSISQYSIYASKKFSFGAKPTWDHIDVEMKETEFGRVYEWAIKLDKSIEPGTSIAMDVVAIDKDADDSYSWLAWGEFSQKLTSEKRCGDIVLAEPGTQLTEVKGKVEAPSDYPGDASFPVRLKHHQNDRLWLQTLSDSTGFYSLTVPVGQYEMSIPEDLKSDGNRFIRVSPTDPILISAGGDQGYNSNLKVYFQEVPELIHDTGILHEFTKQKQVQIDQFIQTYQEFYEIPGVSLAIIHNGKLSYYQTYGVKSTRDNEPVSEETLFEAASITKPVFGFVVLRLAEKGIIDLDKPLFEYLPFEALEVTPEYKLMTARHVLIHRSGLPNWGVPLENTPGEQYGYSGEGFEYLKRVVMEITGEDIEVTLQKELIQPMGMYHMEFKDSPELRKVAAIGHQGSNPTYWPIPQSPGMAHSMHTEAKAFTNFAIMLLEEKGLSSDTYQEMVQIHTESDKQYWDDPNYREGAGLGVHVRESPFGNVIGHGGNNGDFKCLFEVYQELDMGYVVFTNSSMGDQLASDLSLFLVEGKGNAGTGN